MSGTTHFGKILLNVVQTTTFDAAQDADEQDGVDAGAQGLVQKELDYGIADVQAAMFLHKDFVATSILSTDLLSLRERYCLRREGLLHRGLE